jgi:multidrug efflux pump
MCLLSALAGVAMARMDINIFVQVGFIVLIGLAAKNAILVVEFASERQKAGESAYDATLEAGTTRLRPIVMTSFAFILGVLPLVIGHGAGAEMRRTLGTAVFSGMIGVTLFGIFLTPVFYYIIVWVTGSTTAVRPAAATLGNASAEVIASAPAHTTVPAPVTEGQFFSPEKGMMQPEAGRSARPGSDGETKDRRG